MADARRDLTAPPKTPGLNIPLKAYATRVVKQRLHQERFRYLVLTAYRSQCAMCRLRHTLCWTRLTFFRTGTSEGRLRFRTESRFVEFIMVPTTSAYSVSTPSTIHIRSDVFEEHDGPMLRHGLQELHGSLIQVNGRRNTIHAVST